MSEFEPNNIRKPLPMGSRRLSAAPVEVLEKVVTTECESAREYILQRIGNGEVVGMVVYGPSGSGKTTFTRQHALHIWHSSLGTARIHVISSGSVMNDATISLTNAVRRGSLDELEIDHTEYPLPELDSKKDLLDREQLTPPMWAYIADLMANRIIDATNRASESSKSSQMEIVIGDVAGMGKNGRLAASLRKVHKAAPKRLLYIATPANPDIEGKALRVRTEAAKLLADFLVARGAGRFIGLNAAQVLAELKPEEIESVDRFFKREYLVSDADRVVTLLDIYEGARPKRLREVNEAFDREVNAYTKSIGLKDLEHPLYAFLKSEIGMVDEYKRGIYLRRILFALDSLQTMIGLPEGSDLGRVAIIPYLEEQNIHNYPAFVSTLAT